MASSLLELCVSQVAALLQRGASDSFQSDRQRVSLCQRVLALPNELVNLIIHGLSPLGLYRFKQQTNALRLKRKEPGDVAVLDYEGAWKRLVNRDHCGLPVIAGRFSWEQLYWEAHIQNCLDYAADELRFEGRLRHIVVPDRLLQRIGTKDLASLDSLISQFAGFLRTLRIHGILCLEELHDLLQPARLVSISFYCLRNKVALTTAFRIVESKSSSLRQLKFSYCSLLVAGFVESLRNVRELNKLVIVYSDIVCEHSGFSDFLRQSRSLQTVELVRVRQRGASRALDEVLFQSSKSLTTLHLNEMLIQGFNSFQKPLDGLSSFRPHLKTLDLKCCSLDAACFEDVLRYMECLPCLETVNLSDNPLEDAGLRLLSSFLNSSSNRILNLDVGGCEFTEVSAGLLLDGPCSFKSLRISENFLAGCVANIAGFLERCPVEAFDISNISLGSVGCTPSLTSALINSRSLVHLNISMNRLGAAGAQLLHDVISGGQGVLTSINASYNIFNAEALALLATAVHAADSQGRCIRHLDLRGSPGTSATVLKMFEPFVNGREPVVLLSALPPSQQDDEP